jgi:histidinol-phosphate aminotransferase
MSVFWNSRVKNLSPYIPGEQPKDRQFIKLNTNENPYPPSPGVIEALRKAAGETLRLYPDPASTELREAAARSCGLRAEQVFPGNGSDEVLAFAFAAFFGNGSLLFPDITYSFYPVYAELWNIPFRTIPLREDFSVDPGVYIEAQAASGGPVIANPNAPTGMALPLTGVRKIAEAAERNKRVFIVDEAYAAFAEKTISCLPLLNEFPNLLLIRTLSKEASLAGLRVGFALGSEELIEGLCRVRDSFNSYTMDRLAQAGAAAAIKDTSYYEEINRRIAATRRRVSAGLESLGFTVLPSQANFVFASPPASAGKTAKVFFSSLREQGFLVRHFDKPRISGFLRISMGTDSDMDAFLEACREIMND